MVVIAVAVMTKNGKTLVSRQSTPTTKVKIEGLLAAFPKLLGADASQLQHTFVETDQVRYVFQPVESLYAILITNKQSNIIEDLDTLRTVVKLIPEYCRGNTEEAVLSHVFELIFAIDEVISLGYKENVTLPQIKTFTDMDSHEEKLQKIITDSKINETREIARRKAEAINKQKQDLKKAAGMGGYSPRQSHSSDQDSGIARQDDRKESKPRNTPSSASTTTPQSSSSTNAAKTSTAKGMQLSKKKKTTDAFMDALGKEEVLPKGMPGASGSVNAQQAKEVKRQNVHVTVEEKIVCAFDRDATLKKIEIKGELKLCVNDPDVSRVMVHTGISPDAQPSFQFRLLPKIDKNPWTESGVLTLKDPTKPFPVGADNAPVILKWRIQPKDSDAVPFNVTVWVNDEDGQSVVSAEIELIKTDFVFSNIYISIPSPSSEPPTVAQHDGDFNFHQKDKVLVWFIPTLDSEHTTANLEFSVPAIDNDRFYPVHISFTSPNTYSGIKVDRVTHAETGDDVEFTADVGLSAESYVVE